MENEKMELLLGQIKDESKEQKFLANRLLSSEKHIKMMNIYYAAFASVTAVLSLIYPECSFSQLSAVLTVLLSLLVIALSAQKYAQQARHYHVNAHALDMLLLEAQEDDEIGKYSQIRAQYAVLSANTDSRSSHDNRAVLRMHDIENRRRVLRGEEVLRTHYLCGYEKFKYWFAEIVSIIMKVMIFIFPAAGLVLAAMNLI